MTSLILAVYYFQSTVDTNQKKSVHVPRDRMECQAWEEKKRGKRERFPQSDGEGQTTLYAPITEQDKEMGERWGGCETDTKDCTEKKRCESRGGGVSSRERKTTQTTQGKRVKRGNTNGDWGEGTKQKACSLKSQESGRKGTRLFFCCGTPSHRPR